MTFEVPPPLRAFGIRLMEFARRTDAVSLLPELLASQWWELSRLEQLQQEKLGSLGRFCWDEVPFYRELFGDCGLAPQQALTDAALQRLPVLDKDVIRGAGSRLYSRSWRRWQPRRKSTSGSTGRPLNYYLDRPSHTYQWAHLWRGWQQVGYRPGDLYATLSGGSLVPEKVDLKQKIYLALSGALHLPSYHLTPSIMSGYVDLLQRRSVPFLYGYPSSLELFSRYVLDEWQPLPLQAVFTTSEGLSDRARETIEQAFACAVFDTYGCNDGGLYSFECDRHDGFHVGMESVLVEIVDDEGRRLPDGSVGNIVTTNLEIRAMPLLRYRTGDVGALERTPCACGRGLQRIVSLQGRERDFVLTPAGRKVHGAFFNHFDPFYTADWLERFQVYQPDRQTLILRLQVQRDPNEAERQIVLDALERGLGTMDFRLEFVDEMVLTRTGKFRVIISDVA